MTAAESTGLHKYKITIKLPRFDSEEKSQKNIRKSIVRNGQRDNSCADGRNDLSEVKALVKPSMPANSSKRRAEMSLDGHTGKRQKMDVNVKVHCSRILKEFMRRPGWDIFSEPVDPVELKIPDYFSIISDPMDLGTIKRKLEGNMYFSAEEFAADVRLTFSNAMRYNPSWHQIHKLAEQFGVYFSKAWKALETKLKGENKTVKQATSVDDMGRSGKYANKTIQKNCPETKLSGLRKFGTSGKMSSLEKNHEERKPVAPNKASGRVCGASRPNVEPARKEPDGRRLTLKTVQKEHCGPSACAFANHRRSHDSSQAKCGSCGGLTCHCHFKNHSAKASLGDISSERSSSEHDHCGQSGPDCEVKNLLASSRSSAGVDSDGPGVVVNEENSSHISTPAAIDEGWNLLNVQMSPNKALRVAKLKSRFADTIFRATHQAILNHGDKSDPIRMQHERERLEREQLAEKARIEAEIKAAEAASQKRAQDDLKMQREIAREAARMALQMMEKTVQIDENLVSLKKLEMLCSPTGEGFGPGSPLEQLGLFMKDDYLSEYDEDEAAILTGEAGEILS